MQQVGPVCGILVVALLTAIRKQKSLPVLRIFSARGVCASIDRMHLSYRWRSRPDTAQLEHTVDQLRTELIKLRRQLSGKEQYIDRLKFLCHERTTRIDDLRATIDDLRAANQKLDAEAEHLAALIAAPDAAMLAPK